MTVAAIINEKGRDVVTAAPDKTVSEVCAVLAEHKIGAVVLLAADQTIAGIISERDIVQAIAAGGPKALDSAVSRYMTGTVLTCTDDDTIATVMERMTRGRFRHLPVVSNDRLAGLISIGDVVKYRIAQAERDAEDMRSYIATV